MIKQTLLRCIYAGLLSASLYACTESHSSEKKFAVTDSLQLHNDSVHRMFNQADAAIKAYQLDTFFHNMHKKRAFNGTVLIAQHGHIIYKGAFGYADLRKKDTLTTSTAFQLASVSKQFTAMAVMMLQERGLLSYDDEVQKFYPEFPYDGITVRMLLTHRSGLPDYTYFSEDYWKDRSKFLDNQEVIKMMANHQPKPYYLPNKRYDYSNTGYSVLAAIVEKASGMKFENFMQKEVFKPLGMTQTWVFNGTNTALSEKIAIGYTAGRRVVANSYLNGATGDKGVYSTVEDLFKWDRALYSGKLVKATTLEEAFQPANKEMKKENYGYGWRLKTLDCGQPVVYHGGWWHGYKSYFMRNRKDQSTIIVLTNIANHSLGYLKNVLPILYPEQTLLTVSKPTPTDSIQVSSGH